MKKAKYQTAKLPHEVPYNDLRWKCPLELIPAETTEDIEPIEGIIGQDRALNALKLGVELFSPGYNIFVCGLSGTGKATTIKTILEKIQPLCAPPSDYCYVFNFRDQDRPILLRFQRGKGSEFRVDVAETISQLKRRVPRIFEEDEYIRKRQSLVEEYNKKETELFTEFESTIVPDGFVLGRVQEGQMVHPEILMKIDGKAVLVSEIGNYVASGAITEEQANEIIEKYKEHRNVLQSVFRKGVHLSREYQKRILDHEREVVSMVINAIFAELLEKYTDTKVVDYLQQIELHILNNLDRFKEKQSGDEQEAEEYPEYQVNLILDNKSQEECPVIIETVPTYTNVFGTIERVQDSQGYWYTDFTKIKSGSLLRADGGYLVLYAIDVLTEPGVWKALQRALLYRKLEIQPFESQFWQSTTVLKPEAIELNVKVILIGNNEIFWLLNTYEHDFKKIFKVKADFDYEMDNTELAIQQYTALVRKLISDEDLKHFDNTAIAAIVEHGARLTNHKKKLTTQFSEIADIVREANYWCLQNSNRYITAEHVLKAIETARNRHALSEEKIMDLIQSDVILIDVEGSRIGQINGLSVYQGDRYAFGKPTRITAATSAGEAGIINIEREAGLSGRTYDKGVLILTGYLREVFAKDKPLALSASLSFEQSYSGIEGDSASSTEVYAILSSLSGIPIKQQYAVTGSVNQKGDIQPVGGINEKIEGFFDICRKRKLTNEQGVIIPSQNVDNLMLRRDVVEAVREGRFHIYPINRIEEGIEILTGIKAGERDKDGNYPENTVFGQVAERLAELSELAEKRKNKKTKKETAKKVTRKPSDIE